MLSGILIKTSLVDFPGRVAATYFISGCNIRCPYCYNVDLVNQTLPKEDTINTEDLFNHLIKRKNVLSGFVLSGGEPLIYNETAQIIKKAKELGYTVKLDTNGLLPDRLEELFKTKETTPDYIAVDVKTSPDKYNLLQYSGNAYKKLIKTIDIVKALPVEQIEYRTVLCPSLVKKEDIITISKMIPVDAKWFFAPFRNEQCLDEEYNTITPYTETEMLSLVEHATKKIHKAQLR